MPAPLRARDVMQPRVLSVAPTTTLADLEDFLLAHRIGGVPVVEDGALVGIVSRSDVVRAFGLDRSLAGVIAEAGERAAFAPAETPLAGGAGRLAAGDLADRLVRDVMVPEVVTVAPETPLAEVARLLVSRHLHRVLVVEGRSVRGVISALDVVRLVAEGRVRE